LSAEDADGASTPASELGAQASTQASEEEDGQTVPGRKRLDYTVGFLNRNSKLLRALVIFLATFLLLFENIHKNDVVIEPISVRNAMSLAGYTDVAVFGDCGTT
jgi:hypothetical protein